MTDDMDEPVNPRDWSAHEAGLEPTPRELEVFVAVVEHGTKGAASALGISFYTARNHVSSLYARIGAKSRSHAVALLYGTLAGRYRLPRDGPLERRKVRRRR